MLDTFFNFISDKYPIIGFIIIVIAATAFITVKIVALYTRIKVTENTINTIPCSKHNDHIKEIQSNIPILGDIKESIRKIEEYIIRKDGKAMDSLVRKFSPYKLTNFGDILLIESKAKDCIDNNTDYFVSLIEKMNPLVALDVEQYSLSVLNDNIKNDYFNDIKNYIYKLPDPTTIFDEQTNTSVETSINLESILLIMSIYLRDKYFEKHPGIDTSQFFDENKKLQTS